jgi:hypothetical protein
MNAPFAADLFALLRRLERANEALNNAASTRPLDEDAFGLLEQEAEDAARAFDDALIARIGIPAERVARAVS